MRVLITGCSAAQCNPQSHKKSYNFVGSMWDTIRSDEHEVFWQDPFIEMDEDYLSKFDRVIVGVSPMSALGANRLYGALSVIERLWGSDKLALVVDAPEPVRIQTSLRAVVDHPESLCKPFFAYRKEFGLASEKATNKRLQRAVHLLAEETWPTTIAPRLPWHDKEQFASWFPVQVRESLRPLSFDGVIFDKHEFDEISTTKQREWALEMGSSSRWAAAHQVSWPVRELPRTFRVETNTTALKQIAGSEGVLITPSRDGTWWSPRYAMATTVATPVFTDWHESGLLGDAWSVLPTTYETYEEMVRRLVGWNQREAWLDAVPDTATSLRELWDTLGLEDAKRRGRRVVR